jgi:hypothetical protein
MRSRMSAPNSLVRVVIIANVRIHSPRITHSIYSHLQSCTCPKGLLPGGPVSRARLTRRSVCSCYVHMAVGTLRSRLETWLARPHALRARKGDGTRRRMRVPPASTRDARLNARARFSVIVAGRAAALSNMRQRTDCRVYDPSNGMSRIRAAQFVRFLCVMVKRRSSKAFCQ